MNVTLHLTSGCNMRCTYCFEGDHSVRTDMPEEVARAAIDFALRDGGESPGIVFFGGEPLLRRDLIARTIEYTDEACRTAGGFGAPVIPHFKITTNGLLLDDQFLSLCAERDVSISLSIDGVKRAHDRHRLAVGGQGTWDRVAERARALLAKKPYSPAIMVCRPDTVRWAAEGVRELFAIGFRYLLCQVDYSAPWDEASLGELGRQYRLMAELYLDKTRREEKFYLAPFDLRIATHIRGAEARDLHCKLGVRQVSVAPDGALFPCVQFVPGEARDGKHAHAIGDVWRGIVEELRAERFEQTEREAPECSRCAVKDRCTRHCGCMNLQTTGSLGQPSPVLCAHERMVIPIADEIAGLLWRERSPMFVQKHYNRSFAILSLIEDRAAGCG